MNKYELAGNQLLEEYGITVKTVRKSMTGVAYLDDKVISAPAPKKAESFAVFAHEVGHIANGNIRPRWLEELKAWQFSIDCFKRFGFQVSKVVKHHMRFSLAYALAKALNRGMKQIPTELKPYKKYLSPIVYLYGDGSRANRWHADSWKTKHL